MVYKQAAKLAKSVAEGAGLKRQLYNSDVPHENLRGVAFLATNALKQQKVLDAIISDTDLKSKLSNEIDGWLIRVLVVELCLGRKSFRATGPIEKLVYRFKKNIKALGAHASWEKKIEIPRYVRINTLVTSLNHVEAQLEARGFKRVKYARPELNTRKSLLGKIDNLKQNEYILDMHVPNLLIFHPSAKLAEWDLVDNGTLLLQDKSSCFVAPLVAPHPGSVTLDMCAAPGFKTQHLATYLQGIGKIIAVDKSVERYKALSDLMNKFELDNVHCLNKDALDCLEPEERDKIEYILLDPPCSGSGVVTNYDYSSEKKKNSKRLEALHNLQCSLLRSALTNYPAARRVVYSTCSMNEEENEQVIEEFAQPPCGFVLVDLSNFYKEVSRGFETYSSGKRCIRLSPETERTNGFFIAMFERLNPNAGIKNAKKAPDEENLEIETKRRRLTLEEHPSADEITKEIDESGTSSVSSENSEDPPPVIIENEREDLVKSPVKQDPGCDTSMDRMSPVSDSGNLPAFKNRNIDEYEKDIEDDNLLSIVAQGARHSTQSYHRGRARSRDNDAIINDNVQNERKHSRPDFRGRKQTLGCRFYRGGKQSVRNNKPNKSKEKMKNRDKTQKGTGSRL